MKHFVAITIFLSYLKFSVQSDDLQRLESFYSCEYDNECLENSFCHANDVGVRGRCRCKVNYIMLERNRTNYECLSIAEGIDSPCSKDLQCHINMGTSSICNGREKVCKCAEGAFLGGDSKCYKAVGLGELCSSNYNCRLSDGSYEFCVDGRCSCNIQHHPSEDKQRCIKIVLLGKPCSTSESCIHTFANCYGGICKCVGGYIESDDNRFCLKAANRVGDNCTESIQCGAYITGSFCDNEVCVCKSAHHGYGNECVPDAKLGDRCIYNKECILSQDLEHSVHCTGGVCSCVVGISDENSYGCIITDDGEIIAPINFFVTFMLMVHIGQYWL